MKWKMRVNRKSCHKHLHLVLIFITRGMFTEFIWEPDLSREDDDWQEHFLHTLKPNDLPCFNYIILLYCSVKVLLKLQSVVCGLILPKQFLSKPSLSRFSQKQLWTNVLPWLHKTDKVTDFTLSNYWVVNSNLYSYTQTVRRPWVLFMNWINFTSDVWWSKNIAFDVSQVNLIFSMKQQLSSSGDTTQFRTKTNLTKYLRRTCCNCISLKSLASSRKSSLIFHEFIDNDVHTSSRSSVLCCFNCCRQIFVQNRTHDDKRLPGTR